MLCRLCQNSGTYRGQGGALKDCFCLAGALRVEKRRRRCNVPLRTKPLQIALAVRRNVEAYALKRGEKPNLQHCCGLASASLALALELAGFSKVELVEGRFFPTGAPKPIDFKGLAKWKALEIVKVSELMIANYLHCWTVFDGTIIDITFSQFDKSAPQVYVTPATDVRYKVRSVWKSQKDAMADVNFIGPKRVIRRLAKI